MRIGSRVSLSRENPDGDWTVPDDAPVGTIIAIATDCDGDGYDIPKAFTIRWDNGLIETKQVQDDEYEIEDVTPWLYANIYLYDRAYGGPEEGGWWYDTYSPIDDSSDWNNPPPQHGHFSSEKKARKALLKLQAWCNEENKSRRSPSSVASDGHYMAQLDAWPAEFSPKQRPHYC